MVIKIRKKRGIPDNWRPDRNIFRKECDKYTIRELASKYDVCMDTICNATTICDALTGRSWVQAFGGEKNNRSYKSRE
jgi:hypothetical protein